MSHAWLITCVPLGLLTLVMLLSIVRLRTNADRIMREHTTRQLEHIDRFRSELEGQVHYHLRSFQCAVLHGEPCRRTGCTLHGAPLKPPSVTQDVPEQPTPQASLPEARVVLRGKRKP